jgi:hypothetical protein
MKIKQMYLWFQRGLSNKYFYIFLLIAIFAIVYATSLTFVYVEGDDAATILYHALGRNSQMASPYAVYQGMFDTVLSLLPVNEPVLRIFAITISALAGVVFTILCLTLVFAWLGIESGYTRNQLSVVAVLLSPELFFLGLVINPSLIAMSLVLTSHLIVRGCILHGSLLKSKGALLRILSSAILFGIGVSFRWSIIVYGLIIVVDLVFFEQKLHWKIFTQIKDRLIIGFLWGGLGLFFSYLAIVISGSDGETLWRVLQGSSQWISTNFNFSLFTLLKFTSLISLVVLLVFFIGFGSFIRRRMDLTLIVLVSFLPIIPVLYSGEAKQMITFFPALFLCALLGVYKIAAVRPSSRNLGIIIKVVMICFIIAPWIIGIKIYSPDTLWGPGFEMRKPGESINPSKKTLFNAGGLEHVWPDRILSIGNIMLGYNDGLAYSTAEGPRPLGAYGAVLLGGKWRSFVLDINTELDQAIQLAVKKNIPILMDDMYANIYIRIISKGFFPDTQQSTIPDKNGNNRYVFKNSMGREIIVYSPFKKFDLYDPEKFLLLQEKIGKTITYAVYLVGDSSSGLEMFTVGSNSVEPLGSFHGLIDLQMYLSKLNENK